VERYIQADSRALVEAAELEADMPRQELAQAEVVVAGADTTSVAYIPR
jgi:hypothetical protein